MTTESTLHIRAHAICANRSRRDLDARFLLLPLALLGYGGTLWSAIALYQLPCHLPIVLGIAGSSFCLAALLQWQRRFAGGCTVLIALALLCVPLFVGEHAIVGVQNLVNQYYRLAHHTDIDYFRLDTPLDPTGCTTLVVSLVVALLALFFVWFTVRHPLFLMTAAIIFLILEPGLYMGIALYPPAAIPLVAYCSGMLAMRLAMRRSIAAPHTHIAIHCGMITALLTATVYGGLVLAGAMTGYARSQADRDRRHTLSHILSSIDLRDPSSFRAFGSLFQSQKDADHSTLGTQDQLEQDEDTELVVTFQTLPEHAIYLKGFTGCTYGDNQWVSDPAADMADQADQINGMINSFQCAPQSFSFLFQRSLTATDPLVECTIEAQGNNPRQYQPYLSYSGSAQYEDDGSWRQDGGDSYRWIIADPQQTTLDLLSAAPLSDNLCTLPENEDPVVARFLEALGLEGNQLMCSSRFSMSQAAADPTDINGKVIPAALFESTTYRSYAHSAYTRLPDESALEEVYAALPASLLELAQPQQPQQQYETLYALRSWIASCTTYTTSPGRTPGTRDFINFFLLENGQGYCMHYATAGTVLARYLGIPARYCEGYIIGTDTLATAQQTEDGFAVTLGRAQSHAWCEFYIDGYGWVPFEMTPGYYQLGSTDPSQAQQLPQSGIETTPVQPTTTTTTTTTTQTTATQPSTSDTTQTTSDLTTQTSSQDDETGAGTSSGGPDAGSGRLWWILIPLGLLLLVIGLAVGHLLRQRTLARRRRILSDTQNPRRGILLAYRDTLRLLRVCGIPYRGQLPLAYCEALPQALAPLSISPKAPQAIIRLALAADMGNHLPTPEEQHSAAKAYFHFAKTVYQAQGRFGRLRLRLLHLI